MLEELKGLLKKPMSMITLVGVALIPTLYNVIFLSSMWESGKSPRRGCQPSPHCYPRQ